LRRLGQPDSLLARSEAELDAVMAIADKDGDGEVDYTELVKMTEDKDRLAAQVCHYIIQPLV
jgi:hypothetical protein